MSYIALPCNLRTSLETLMSYSGYIQVPLAFYINLSFSDSQSGRMKEPHREPRTFFLHQPAVDRHVDHRLDSSIDIFSRLSKIRNCQRPRASTRYSLSEQRPPGDRTKSKNPSLKVPEEKALRKNRVPEKKQPLSSSNDSTEYFCDSLFLSLFPLSRDAFVVARLSFRFSSCIERFYRLIFAR